MKKQLISILFAVAVTVLTGCSGHYSENQVMPPSEVENDYLEDEVESDTQEQSDATTLISENALPDTAEADNSLFEAFLKGEAKADVLTGEDVTITEFIDAYGEYLAEDQYMSEGESLKQTQRGYAYIDAGLDGKNELVVKQVYEQGDIDMLECYFIFDIENGKVTLIDDEGNNSRGSISITYSGIINSSGSNGACSHSYTESFITADGKREFVYLANFESGISMPLIPYYYIPESVRPADYPMDFATDCLYECACYTFSEAVDDDSTEAIDDYYSSFFFTIYDANSGESVEPDADYKNFFDEQGIKFYSAAELETVLNEREKELSLPEEAKESQEVEYTAF